MDKTKRVYRKGAAVGPAITEPYAHLLEQWRQLALGCHYNYFARTINTGHGA